MIFFLRCLGPENGRVKGPSPIENKGIFPLPKIYQNEADSLTTWPGLPSPWYIQLNKS